MLKRLNALLPWTKAAPRPVVPVVRLSGVIGGAGLPFRSALTLAAVSGALDKAFAVKRAPAVALLINSPGGSAVQSHLIYRRIRLLAEEKQKTVLVFVEDVAASGGYMIACAGDAIFADPSSIVGSIGVVSQGFGFVGLMERIGVERRIYTAGDNKAILDPFQPQRPEDVAHLKLLQADVHAHFIALVRSRRADRLVDDPELFSGLFWSGSAAIALGLVDELGEARAVLRDRYGRDVALKLIQVGRPSFWRRAGAGIAVDAAHGAFAAAEERALWSRYGL